MGTRTEKSLNKLERVKGSITSIGPSCNILDEENDKGQDRQYHHVCHNQQARESQTLALASTSDQDCIHLRNLKDLPLCRIPTRQSEYHSRPIQQEELTSPIRTENPPQRFSSDRGNIREESNRPICQQRQSPTPAILLSECGPKCPRRFPTQMARQSVHLSVVDLDKRSASQDTIAAGTRNSLGTADMDNTIMVART